MNVLLNVILIIILTGIGLWLVNRLIPMAAIIKMLLNLLVFIVLVLYVLQSFDLITPIMPQVTLVK